MSNQIAQQVHREQNNNQQNMHVRHRKQFKLKQQSSHHQTTTQVQVKKNAGLPPFGNTTWLDQHRFVITVLLCDLCSLIVTAQDTPTTLIC